MICDPHFNNPFGPLADKVRARAGRTPKCKLCARRHAAELPHNADSLVYKLYFRAKHGREPTWHDAMRHCAKEVKDKCRARLFTLGVDIGADPQPKGDA